MIRRLLDLVPLLLVTGCATPPPASVAEGACTAAPVQAFVGRIADAPTVADALTASGAKTSRLIPPDTVVTMEFRADRLSIAVDRERRIMRINCG